MFLGSRITSFKKEIPVTLTSYRDVAVLLDGGGFVGNAVEAQPFTVGGGSNSPGATYGLVVTGYGILVKFSHLSGSLSHDLVCAARSLDAGGSNDVVSHDGNLHVREKLIVVC